MKMMVLMLDDKMSVLGSAFVQNIPDDLQQGNAGMDVFADLEQRLRDVAGKAAVLAHQKAAKTE